MQPFTTTLCLLVLQHLITPGTLAIPTAGGDRVNTLDARAPPKASAPTTTTAASETATATATSSSSSSSSSTSNNDGYFDPADGGGSMLTGATSTSGEPLNIIISGKSDAEVLEPSGFFNYWQSLNFSTECLGLHLGGYQNANLGDGNGRHNQSGIYRYDFGIADGGTCQESIDGGNHVRFWRQNGSSADTGAYFVAASVEMNDTYYHNIVSNGYDLGRDNIVAAANASSGTSMNGVTYHTAVQMVSGLLQSGSQGINHGISIDGLVALFTVSATNETSSTSSKNSQTSGAGHVLLQLKLYDITVVSALTLVALCLLL